MAKLLGIGFWSVALSLVLFLPASPVCSQDSPASESEQNETIATLQSLLTSLDQVERQIKEYQKELKTPDGQARQEELAKDLDRAQAQQSDLERSFEQISTGVDLNAFEAQMYFQFDWASELRDLVSPIIGELRALTDRPRELERLRREVAYHSNRMAIIEKALKRIAERRAEAARLGDQAESKILIEQLSILEQKWKERLQQAGSSLAAGQHKLSEKLAERKSVFQSMHQLFASFFKTRGRNILLALLSFFVVMITLRYFHRVIDRLSPWHRRKNRSFAVRVIDVLYYGLTYVFSFSAVLIVLYMYGDWVLLGLALLFLLGLAWAARQGLPLFWQQAQLLMNLGTVREGEEVTIDGLPWKVETVNVYTQLVNTSLKGGYKRLPLRDLVAMRSRPRSDDEPWFPCREEDWVILNDGTKGKVLVQTPEMVRLVKLGGSHVTYATSEFLNQSPMNISRGFRLQVTFGVDYAHQAIVVDQVPEKMKQVILAGLTGAGHDKDLVNLIVEFQSAGASSLDVQILGDFSGQAAPRYDFLERLINRLAVEACNQYQWVIPFTQVTLHQA